MTIPAQAFIDQIHIYQRKVLRLLDTPLDQGGKRLFDLEWHRKSRKTTMALNILIREGCRNPKCVYSYVAPCYDDQTEILTDNGWLLFSKLQDEKVAVLKNNKELVFETPIEKYKYPYDGELIGIKSPFVDLLMTPHHRCLVQKLGKNTDWVIKRAEEIYLSDRYKMKKTASIWVGKKEYAEDWFEFLGFWFAEGCARLRTHQKGNEEKKKKKFGPKWCESGEVTLTQKVRIEYVEDLLKRNNIPIKKHKRTNGGFNYNIYDTKLAKELVQYGNSLTKFLPAYIKNADKELIEKFLYGYWMGDGHFAVDNCDTDRSTTASKQLADDIQELIIKIGGAATVSAVKGYNWFMVSRLHKKHYEPHIYKKHWYKQPYTGDVYCVKVSSGIVMVRRNGKQCWCGNTYKQARAIVWDDPQMLDKYLPDKKEMWWKKNEQKLQVRFANGALLRILGADDVDSLRGPDNMGVVFDEWQLIDPTAWSAVFFPMINLFPDRWAIFLWTAFGRNHAQELQERRTKDPAWFVATLPAYDTSAGKASGLLTEAQLAAARIEMPETLYRQEYGCESIAEEEMCLINSAMIEDLKQIKWSELPGLTPLTRKIVSIDTAFGGDICSIRGIVNTRSLVVEHCHPLKTEEIVLKAKQMCKDIGTKNIISDCIGNGKGVTDMLASDEAGYNVQYFNSANSPANKETSIYANRRAEAYGYTSDQIRKQRIQPVEEKELIRQLPKASRYKPTSSGKMLIIPKTEIRKDLGCSPDDADSFVMGIWGLQFVTPEEDLSLRGEAKSDKRYGIDEARRHGKVIHNPMVGC
jgi:hypothetical protein